MFRITSGGLTKAATTLRHQALFHATYNPITHAPHPNVIMDNGKLVMHSARKFPARAVGPSVNNEEDVFTSATLKEELIADLTAYIVPFSQKWAENFRPSELVAVTARIIDNAVTGDAATEVSHPEHIKLPSLSGSAAFQFGEKLQHTDSPSPKKSMCERDGLAQEAAETVDKNFPMREGAVSRRGYTHEMLAQMEQSAPPKKYRFSLPANIGRTIAISDISDIFHKKGKADSSPEIQHSSIPRTDSLPVLSSHRQIQPSGGAPPARRRRVNSLPPLSAVPHSLAACIDELSPTQLDPLIEVPSPTKSLTSPSKPTPRTHLTDSGAYLSPAMATTPPRAFAIPEIRREKRGLAKGVEKLVKKWEDLSGKAKK